jgi:polar amino acid transport system substrate-binding protein
VNHRDDTKGKHQMTFTRRARRLIAASLAALPTLLVASGCGTATDSADKQSNRAAFDRVLHNALPPAVRASGVLRVATDASYAPASSFGSDGRSIVGFEPDLGAALGRVLGVRVQFVNTDFSKVLSDVAAHRIDLAMSAVTDTRERERTVDFINYFSAGTAIVVQRGNPGGITDLAGLCGHTVAVEKSTIQIDLLARSQKQCAGRRVRVRTYDTNADALVQLRTGRASAVLNDYPPAAFLASDPRTRAHYQLASTAQYEPGLYGVAVAKDRPRLRATLQAALGRVMRAGEYRQVLHRWGVADGAVAAPSINGGGT